MTVTRRRPGMLAVLVLLIVLVDGAPAAARAASAQTPEPVTSAEVADDVTAGGAVLWDPLDGRALWSRAADVPRRMASTTKIMTALLAIEAGTLDDTVTVSSTADAADREPGAATLALRAGSSLSMESLLTGLLLRSGNDAAVAVAEHVAGSQRAFVAQMNARAKALGLRDTNFVDASGLTDDPAHHASPRDLARLGRTAMAEPAFARIVGMADAVDPQFGALDNRNELLAAYPGATGIKTGYTGLAGRCLVASATRDGRTLYAVVLGSDDSFGDTADLLDHGYGSFFVAAADDAVPTTYRTAAGAVALELRAAGEHTVGVDDTAVVRTRLLPQAPERVRAGTVLGTATMVVDGDVVERAELAAAEPLRVADPGSEDNLAGRAVADALRALARSTPRRTRVDRIVRDAG